MIVGFEWPTHVALYGRNWRLADITVAVTHASLQAAQAKARFLSLIAKRGEEGAEPADEVTIDLVGDHLAGSVPRYKARRGQRLEVGRHSVLCDLKASRYLSGGQSVRLRQEERNRTQSSRLGECG
jgi:hypothetical protein